MQSWTMEVLKELGAEKWGAVFRFSSLTLEGMYEAGIFSEPLWYRPDVEKPVKLLGD